MSLTKSSFITGLQCHKLLWYSKNKREVFPEDLDKYKKQNIPIFECSAKENINIDLIFEFILEYIHKKIKNKEGC